MLILSCVEGVSAEGGSERASLWLRLPKGFRASELHERRKKDGTRETVFGLVQRFVCRNCGFRFSEKSYKVCLSTKNRQLCATSKEAKKLDAATEIKTVAGDEKQREQEVKGLILQFEVSCKNDGKEQTTIESYSKRLLKISENVDIDNPESVKAYIATKETDNTKAGYVVAYSAYLSWQGKNWKAPKYRVTSPIPEFIPTEEEIDQLVAGCGKKIATILQVLKETGMRIGECMRLAWTSLNDKDNILTLNKPEKHGLPRIFKISPKLVMMIQALPKQHEKIFGNTSAKDAACSYSDQRKRLALKVGNPRLAKINFHLIRHWFGTTLYHKTHDSDYVRRMLGHRNAMSTQVYINMEQALFSGSANEYHIKIALNPEEACRLIEVGFDYVTGEYSDGGKIFRKRK